MVELADSLDSGSSAHSGRAGSSPASRTMASVLTAFERLLRTLAFFHTSARFHSFRESAQIQEKFRASPLLEEKPGLFMVSTLIIDTSSKKPYSIAVCRHVPTEFYFKKGF